MDAVILNVGNELLSGKTINTNASYLAKKLDLIGIKVNKINTVGDNKADIKSAVANFLKSHAQLLITTGGLGPTHDDFTKEVICEALNLKLVYNEAAANDMLNYFGETKTDCNVKQAYFPENAQLIPNLNGSADGLIINHQDKIIILLVGPPYELKPMFENTCIPYLKPFGTKKLIKEYIVMGNSESYFENLLSVILTKYQDIEIAPYAENGRIRYLISTDVDNEESFNNLIDEFTDLMDNYIISNNNESIEEVVVKELIDKNLTISFAESVTGGMLASLITSIPHASKVLNESLVTYSGEAKQKYLNINDDIIKNNKIVSEACSIEMVNGLYKLTNSSVCASVTGFAGPDGDDVGKVYYAIKANDVVIKGAVKFGGNREMVRIRASRYILYQIHIILKEMIDERKL